MSEYALSVEDAMARLEVVAEYDNGSGPQPCVHTFRDSPVGLLGAHWTLSDARAAMETHGVEISGSAATAAKHGVVVIDSTGPVFFETKAESA